MSDMRFASSMEIIGHGDSVLSPSAIFRRKNFEFVSTLLIGKRI